MLETQGVICNKVMKNVEMRSYGWGLERYLL